MDNQPISELKPDPANERARAEIAVAAQWWADLLKEEPLHENGDGYQTAWLTTIARQHAKRPTDEQIQKFKEALEAQLSEGDGKQRFVNVDYHPCEELEAAALCAGIKDYDFLLPCKTRMWIRPGSVLVSKGYGAKEVEIFAPASTD